MKVLQRYYLSLLLSLILPVLLFSQQNEFGWRLGVYSGVMTYQGDLSYRLVDPNPTLNDLFFDNLDYLTYGLSLERRLSNAFSLGLMWTDGEFIANDRSIDWNGQPQFQNPDFERALNARTELWDASAYLTYHLDNGTLLGRRAVVAPYLKAGAGLTSFQVFGNLFYGPQQNQRYFYSDNGAVLSAPPDVPDSKPIEQDGIYETKLSGLQTEGVRYDTDVLSLSGGFGIKFRLGRFNINLESLLRWVNTDYLDDVSGGPFPENFDNALQAYASNPAGISRPQRGDDNKNDLYAFTSLSLHFNFARKKSSFIAPNIVTGPMLISDAPPLPSPTTDTSRTKSDKHIASDVTQYTKADSLQQIVDSLRQQMASLRTNKIQSDRAAADSLRLAADSLRLIADSLQERALLLYAVSPDTDAVNTGTGSVYRIPFPSTLRDTMKVDDNLTPQKPTTDTSFIIQAAPAGGETVSDANARTARSNADTSAIQTTVVSKSASQQEMPVDADTTEEARKEYSLPPPAATDTLPQTPATDDEALMVEMTRLRNQVEALSAKVEEESQPDTTLQATINDLQGSLQDMQAEIRELRSAFSDRPQPADTLVTRQQVNAYRQELNKLRQEIAEVDDQSQTEQRRLISRYESTLSEIEQTSPRNDQARYEELEREIDQLRQQLNLTGGVSLYAASRESGNQSTQELQTRVDSLEQALLQLKTNQIVIDSAALADTSLTEKIERLNQRLDRISSRQQIDPTSDLLRARILQQRDTLNRLQNRLMQQQQTTEQMRDQIAGLEEQLASLRTAANSPPAPEKAVLQRRIVFFNVGSYSLDPSARQSVDAVAQILADNPNVRLRLEGYTDSSGNAQLNRRLAEQRTLSVKEYLLMLGVAVDRISTLSVGIDTDAPRPAYGRRVEMHFVEK